MNAPEYVLRYKRRRQLLWRRKRKVIGHSYDRELDRLTLIYADGSLEEIAKWSECSAGLGKDWVYANKVAIEKQAGQTVPMNV